MKIKHMITFQLGKNSQKVELDVQQSGMVIGTTKECDIKLQCTEGEYEFELFFTYEKEKWVIECPDYLLMESQRVFQNFFRKSLEDKEEIRAYDHDTDCLICKLQYKMLQELEEKDLDTIEPFEEEFAVKKFKIEESLGIRIALMSAAGKMEILTLTTESEGKFYFKSSELKRGLFVEGKNKEWYIKCKYPIILIDEKEKECDAVRLNHERMITVRCLNHIYKVYVEYLTEASNIYHNFLVNDQAEIKIGRSNQNDICSMNHLVSRKHAVIIYKHARWYIKDNGSRNGVFVNGRQIEQTECKAGDCIYIMGLRIIIGYGFLSINDGVNSIIQSDQIHLLQSTNQMKQRKPVMRQQSKNKLFNRNPRNRKALKAPSIMVEAPPMSMNSDNIPLILRMGGSMVMSGRSAMMGNYTMMLSSVLFPILTQKYTEKQKKEYEERRVQKYHEYLDKKKKEILKEIHSEEQILNENYPELSIMLNSALEERSLWERRNMDDDFLSLRLGYGRVPLQAEIEYPTERFEIDEDVLENEMHALVEKPYKLSNVPLMASLTKAFVCGVLGKRPLVMEFVWKMLLQLCSLHSYDDVKIVCLLSEKELEQMEYIRYFPHIWNDKKDFRFLATNTSEAYQISEYLKKELEKDLANPRKRKEILKERPYYVVFAFDKKIFDSMEILKNVLKEEENIGVSVLAIFDELPKETCNIFQLNDNMEHDIIYLKEIERERDHFRMDSWSVDTAYKMMSKLFNTNLKVLSEAYSLPKMITFLEMFEVGKVEYLNPLIRWKENNPTKSLSAPVGVATDGTLFSLDLHEKYQGPHGLVAGMTGSGKSEFIITYILSMAVNYHPDEVSFVLIDYKGGGLAGAFEDPDRGIHLPHLVGTITNLDGTAIQRSLMSIESELKRRQRIFNEAKSMANEGTMDIYDYQKLYRAGIVTEPLPHLFIISDEFAELKQQEPEFMAQLISAARIGRSLGVHLILATQKPAGVVNDQILSNTKFRVCLRVQDRADSMDMLKRPEAAELTDTGRFYLQVGYNEYFALGQSAWCGAPYEPSEEVIVQKDDTICFVDTVGQIIVQRRPIVRRKDSGVKQIVSIVKYLSDLAVREEIEPRKLWMEPLPSKIILHDILDRVTEYDSSHITIPVGMVDDPNTQRQFPLILDFLKLQNLIIVGEGGCGKTVLIQDILYTIALKYEPEDVNFYVMDFSSRSLNLFQPLPHCGGVISSEEEDEIERMLNMMRTIIEKRKQLFEKAEVGNFEAYKKVERIPMIFLVIDGISALSGMKREGEFIMAISECMRDGVGYGIRFIITAKHFNECNSKIRQEGGDRLVLRAKDRYDYSDILGVRTTYVPPIMNGRGMCVVDKACLEFQACIAEDIPNEQEFIRFLRNKMKEIKVAYTGTYQAEKFMVMTEDETFEEFCRKIPAERIPLGYKLADMKEVSMPLQQLYCTSMYFGNPDGMEIILKNIFYALHRENMEIIVCKKTESSLFEPMMRSGGILSDRKPEEILQETIFESKEEEIAQLVDRMRWELMARKEIRNAYCLEHNIKNWREEDAVKKWRKHLRKETRPVGIFLESFAEFCQNINLQSTAMLKEILRVLRGHNIYIFACYEPGDTENLKKLAYVAVDEEREAEKDIEYMKMQERATIVQTIMEEYNKDKFSLLFGGRFHDQNIVSLSEEWSNVKNPCNPLNYNKMLMYYRNEIYSMQMPCGILTMDESDYDEDSIVG